jgi:hypothetical protein
MTELTTRCIKVILSVNASAKFGVMLNGAGEPERAIDDV